MHFRRSPLLTSPLAQARTAFFALCVLLAPLGACSRESRLPLYPVRGKVLVAGRAAPGAFVVFHPAADNSLEAIRPYGHAKDDGSFELTSYKSNDGAPEGTYTVTIVWLQGASPNADPPDRLKGRYRDPKSSSLRATVAQSPTDLDPFELTP